MGHEWTGLSQRLRFIIKYFEHVGEICLPPVLVIVWLHVLGFKWLLMKATQANRINTGQDLTLVALNLHDRLIHPLRQESVVLKSLRLPRLSVAFDSSSLEVLLHRSVAHQKILLPIADGLLLQESTHHSVVGQEITFVELNGDGHAVHVVDIAHAVADVDWWASIASLLICRHDLPVVDPSVLVGAVLWSFEHARHLI